MAQWRRRRVHARPQPFSRAGRQGRRRIEADRPRRAALEAAAALFRPALQSAQPHRVGGAEARATADASKRGDADWPGRLEHDELSLNRLLIPFVPAEMGTQFFGRVLRPGFPLPRERTKIDSMAVRT